MRGILILFALALVCTPAMAEITNPQMVDHMQTEVLETGHVRVSGNVGSISLNISIPQDDSYQSVSGFEVSDDHGPCTGSCSYRMVNDKFGNKVVSISWKNPTSAFDFRIRSVVSVSRRYSTDKKVFAEFLSQTNLVQPADPGIEAIASQAHGSDFEKVAWLSEWINENIRYNNVYSDVNIPAKDIMKLRIGVCKEFSNLLVSFLRNMGYYSAVDVGYVHPGSVYGGSSFLPHGWVEA
jgi:hypothetical protein